MLINLLVSIGILMLLLTIAIPNFKSYQPSLILSNTASSLVSDLRLAQQLTITEQVRHVIEFDDISSTYYLFKVDTATTTLKTVTFPVEVDYQSIVDLSNNYVVFNSYGAVKKSGSVTLINIEGKTKVINIKPSGYIQLVQ